MIYMTFGHLIVFNLIFRFRTGIHVRVQGSAGFEKARAVELKKIKAASRKKPCQMQAHKQSSPKLGYWDIAKRLPGVQVDHERGVDGRVR